ncbi:MAG: polysaccharide biosynthesis C-terminal domain-containing protein [Candidatus Omnitrophica bacterium]|nr:polysaccharide biosynthesis C-terminal domain-containing protein [Candidatus Omnitrophota bacterium]
MKKISLPFGIQFKRPFLSISIFTLLGRSGGLVIPFFIAMIYGASWQTDSFFLAYNLIFALIGIFVHLFESALIPFLVEHHKDDRLVTGFANSVLAVSLGPMTFLSVLIAVGLRPLLQWGSGLETFSIDLVAQIFMCLLPMLFFNVWMASIHSILFARDIFWISAVSPFIRSIVVISFLFFVNQWLGVHALSVGFSFGELVRWAVTFLLLVRLTSWKWRLEWQRTKSLVAGFFREGFLQMLAVLALSLIFVSDQWFASWTGIGHVTLLSYADRLLQIPYILFATAFLQVFLTDWSKTYYDKRHDFWPKLRRDIGIGFVVSFFLAGLLCFFRQPLVGIVYGTRNLSGEERQVLTAIFGWYAISFCPGVLRLLFGRAIIVIKHSKFYFLQACAELILNILMNYVLMLRFGVVGIAMSTALVQTVSSAWLYGYLKYQKDKGGS